MSARTRAPSDLNGFRGRSGQARLRMAGRVVHCVGSWVRLADAFTTVDIQFAGKPLLSAGDLAVVEALRSRKAKLREGVLLARYPAPPTRGNGEFARFSWQGVGAFLSQRHHAVQVMRRYFIRQGFLEVDTPISAKTSGSDPYAIPVRTQSGWLITSPEHHMKRLLVGGIPRIFQFAHCSRSNEHGQLHQPEFMMLEWYRAFAGIEEVMRDTEQLVVAVARALGRPSRAPAVRRPKIDLRRPFERITVREAFVRHAGVSDAIALADGDEARYFELLLERVEPALKKRARPIFLCDFPVSQAPLARPSPTDSSVAERFELYINGVELCNGYGELTDVQELRRRWRQSRPQRRGVRAGFDRRLARAMQEGLPPSGGNALGVDRLVALFCGAPDIASVQAFPASQP
ncbi:MAG TPA: amino acid--tRNA ligase-related protein [Polyangiaceae bacterium]|jgi:lysyl-tRNA synthetase class 2